MENTLEGVATFEVNVVLGHVRFEHLGSPITNFYPSEGMAKELCDVCVEVIRKYGGSVLPAVEQTFNNSFVSCRLSQSKTIESYSLLPLEEKTERMLSYQGGAGKEIAL